MQRKRLDEETLDRIRQIVYSDTPEGFIWFYYLVSDLPLPAHCVEWVVSFYEALDDGKNLAVEAFRGSLKTTIFSTLMPLYQVGLRPELETIIVQASEDMAHDNSGIIADMIENNVGFRVLFPDVRPDHQKGWGAKGYEVIDTGMSYESFRRKRTKSPTLLATGYKSANIQGRHPRGFGILDDINNSRNSRYPREMLAVRSAVEQEITPAFDKTIMNIDVFTPWREGDIGDVAKQREDTLHIRTPIFKMDVNGQLTEDPTWPEEWPLGRIERERNNMAPHIWSQMYLCDLKGAQGKILKEIYLKYIEVEEIPPDIKVYIACDYASVAKDQALRGRDYFALAVVAQHPSGFLILLDGIRKHVDRAEAENVFMNWCADYHKQGRLIRAGIEKQGKGEEFGNVMLKAAEGWKVKLMTSGNRSKGDRFENQLVPVMAGDRFRITTAPNPFIDQFRDEYLSFDGMGTFTDDCLDAVYYAVRLAKGYIAWADEDSLYGGSVVKQLISRNPLHKLARHRRRKYGQKVARPRMVPRARELSSRPE